MKFLLTEFLLRVNGIQPAFGFESGLVSPCSFVMNTTLTLK